MSNLADIILVSDLLASIWYKSLKKLQWCPCHLNISESVLSRLWAIGTGCPVRLWNFMYGNLQKPPGWGYEQLAVGVPA